MCFQVLSLDFLLCRVELCHLCREGLSLLEFCEQSQEGGGPQGWSLEGLTMAIHNLGRKGVIAAYTSTSQSITEGSQGRNSSWVETHTQELMLWRGANLLTSHGLSSLL